MRQILTLILTLLCLSACASNAPQPASTSPASQRALTVFAAASLTESFDEMANAFEASHPGVEVMLNFAGSNTLRAQIEAGAQADVFASANTKEMDALVANGLVRDAPKIFLTNRLVVIVPANNPAELSAFDNLAQPGLKLVLAAEEVPVGRYARLMLDNAGQDFKTHILANVVSNETTVKQVLAKVQLGEADAGIVYTSDAVAAPELPVIEIPTELNVLAEYPIVVLKNAPNSELADEFVAFVLSPEGQAILQSWRFTNP
jgi:molybdate transport system substrate-binding protein